MKGNFRQSMSWLHTWVGLVPGWILFAIFLFGTTAFFQYEISRWMRPELGTATVSAKALDAAGEVLQREATDTDSWSVSLPGARGGDGVVASWIPKGKDWSEREQRVFDPGTGRPVSVRETQGGYFLYRFHFDLHYIPVMWARYLVSIAALAMLVAILSGVVTHKKIFTDFFLLRFGKGQRSWLDAHNITAVLALPFHLMITYTGIVTLLYMLMPWAITANFPSEDAYYQEAYPSAPYVEPTGKLAPTLPLSQIVDRASKEWGGGTPTYISIAKPGDETAAATLYPPRNDWSRPSETLTFSAVTGEEIKSPAAPSGAASATREVMVDLHTGWFAGLALRWLYFLSGVGGTIMVGSGLVLWTVKRRAKLPDPARPHFGFKLVERLNIGFIVGATGGTAAYFLANRLLPLGMAGRADWEIHCLFIAWGVALAWAIIRPAKRAWVETLAASAILYAMIPAVNAITTTRGLLPSLIAGDWVFVSFDLTMLAVAAACAFTARKVARHTPKTVPRRALRGQAAEATA